jgi:OOP family OmpA-OmpF porin
MRHSGSVARCLILIGAASSLASCSGWSGSPAMRGNPVTSLWNVPAARQAPQSPADFNQALAAEYSTLASTLMSQRRDYADADYFARKEMAATHGQAVPPENNTNWLIPLEVPDGYRTQLADGRMRLMAALDRGARDQTPALAARAQVRYDCWVEQMEDDWRTAWTGDCRRDFLAAMDELEGRPAAQPPAAAQPAPTQVQREYRVYFNFNRATLLPTARQIVHQAAKDAGTDKNVKIVVGKADRAGSDAYNLKLSHRRADAVRAELTKDGITAGQIEERWVGEREPPVPTPDGVPEPRNRLVEITIR